MIEYILTPPNALSFDGAKVLLFCDTNKKQQSTFNECKLLVIRGLSRILVYKKRNTESIS